MQLHRRFRLIPTLLISLFVAGAGLSQPADSLRHPLEKHLGNIRQLTHGGTNAEAYFSFDGTKLIFQSTRPPYHCDQIFTMNIDGSGQRLVSIGEGRTTCAYFLPGDSLILYASTHLHTASCPPQPDKSKGYVWGVFNDYDLILARADGTQPRILFQSAGMDAEATVSPRGDRIVFTSTRDGDLELYTMNIDGTGIRRITFEPGYDGGAFFSPDGRRIVYRAHHPSSETELAEYRGLLSQELVKPTAMDLFLCDADGGNRRQLTSTACANFAPFFLPDGKRIIYSSNQNDPAGRRFQLYCIDDNGGSREQITYGGDFNSFPMFSPDGKHLVFVSNRNATSRYEFNVFIADWID